MYKEVIYMAIDRSLVSGSMGMMILRLLTYPLIHRLLPDLPDVPEVLPALLCVLSDTGSDL